MSTARHSRMRVFSESAFRARDRLILGGAASVVMLECVIRTSRAVMFPCPNCRADRISLEATCASCGWSPPALTESGRTSLPRRESAEPMLPTLALAPFMFVAFAGLLLSMAVHVASFTTLTVPKLAMALHVVIFVVWFPTVVTSNRMTRDVPSGDFWKAALRGCPPWMRYTVFGFFAYAIVNFMLCMSGLGNEFRIFSGHWMAFYSTAVAVMYSAARVHRVDARGWSLGHPGTPRAGDRQERGMPIDAPSAAQRQRCLD